MVIRSDPYISVIDEIKFKKVAQSKKVKKELPLYIETYASCFRNSIYFERFGCYIRGLLSGLDRKTIEPVTLVFSDEKEVRNMQYFASNSKGWFDSLVFFYQELVSTRLRGQKVIICIDESTFPKSGNDSVGVARQYCGRLGKVDNCQSGLFLSYVTSNEIGLFAAELYMPEKWFSGDYTEKRNACQVSEGLTFKTKNEMSKEMLHDLFTRGLFEIECIEADASFGSDHTFLDSLPESIPYFVSVRENEYIFRDIPEVSIPEKKKGRGRPCKYPRADKEPITVKVIADDDSIPWKKSVITHGAKGPIRAEIKCVRCISCRKENNFFLPKAEIWLYIRKHPDGTIRYFLSNKPADTSISELNRLATSRWSIEQCFQECKSYLGMTHYETRSYPAWHRHMLLVMIAQLFVTILRNFFAEREIHMTKPMVCSLIASQISLLTEDKMIKTIVYHSKSNCAAYRSHSKKNYSEVCAV
jgi:SRSO17 transposase